MNNEDKISQKENIKEKDEISLINKIEMENNKIIPDNKNIDVDELWDYNSKYKLNYAKFLEIIKKGKYYDTNTNEYLCNLLLMPPKISLSDKISSLNLLSNFYKIKKERFLLYSILNKFDKSFDSLLSIDPALVVNVFVRAIESLSEQGNYIYAYKYLIKTKQIIEKNAVIIRQKYNIDNVENFTEEIKANYIKNVIINRKKFSDDDSIKDGEIEEIKKLIDLLIDEKYKIDEKEYLFAINKKWIIKTKSFIENYIKAKLDNIENFFEESFEPQFIFESYFDIKNDNTEKKKDKDKINNKPRLYFAFPGLINNFEITAFKDYWHDSINLDENYFIKKGKKLNEDYYLINEKDWKILNNIFGSTNEIKRKKNNLDLLKLKFILFDKRISVDNENMNLLKQKYIIINKNLSMKDLKQKIIKVTNDFLNIEAEKEKVINFKEKEGNNNDKNKDQKEIDIAEEKKEKEGDKIAKEKEEYKDKENKENNQTNIENQEIKEEEKESIEKSKENIIKANEEKKTEKKDKEEEKENKENKEKNERKENIEQVNQKKRENTENNEDNKIEEKKEKEDKNTENNEEEKTEKKDEIKNVLENKQKEDKMEIKKIYKNIKNINDLKISFYILDKKKKDLLIELTYAFKSSIASYESLFINEISDEEILDSKPLTNLFNFYNKEKNILLIELFESSNDKFLHDLKTIMRNEFKCAICQKKIDNLQNRFKCDLCNYSLFCSEECSNQSKIHLKIDRLLYTLKEKKFVLSELLTTNINDLLSLNTKHGRIGLGNMGNTCYMNSALQCLSNTEDLTKYFLCESFKAEINNGSFLSSKGSISKAYFDLIDSLWNETATHIVPRQFRYVFCKKTGLFANNEQQDSQEFLQALLDNLHEDLNRITNKKYVELDEKRAGERDEEASKRWWDYHKSRENSIIVDLFHGQYKSTISCLKCGNSSVSYDTYMSLGLPIPTEKTNIQIKLLTSNLNFIDLNIKLNKNTQIKDIIKKAIVFLDIKKYNDYFIKQQKDNNKNYINNNNFEVEMKVLYNNIEIIEFNDNFKMINKYKTSFENIDINKNRKDINVQPSFDNLILSNIYKNNYTSELILFEKPINSNSNNYINIYIYPITTKKVEGFLFTSNKDIILSYPIIFSIKENNSLEDLEALIIKKFKHFFKQSLTDKEQIEICFPHLTKEWGQFKNINNICPLCQKKYDSSKKYCQLANKKLLISDLIKKQSKEKPLILYAKSENYKKRSEFYSGIPLFNEKSSADIKGLRNNLSIYDAFDLFNKEELLEGDNQWYCRKCKTHQNASKKIEIYKTPLYLIVQLKRFKNRNNIVRFILGSKNSTYIDYKEILNLKEFVVGPDKDKSLYNLYAITIHREFMNGGHYYAFCKNKGIWITFDDEKVSYCDNPVSKDAYILFYKRKE